MAKVTVQFTMKSFKKEIDLDFATDSDQAEKLLVEDPDLYAEEIFENTEIEVLDGEYDQDEEEVGETENADGDEVDGGKGDGSIEE